MSSLEMDSFEGKRKAAVYSNAKRHIGEEEYTQVIGNFIPFADPILMTDELKSSNFSDLESSPLHSDEKTPLKTSGPKGETIHPMHKVFLAVVGDKIPFADPNVTSDDDLIAYINKGHSSSDASKCCYATLCGLTFLGLPYLCYNSVLVEQDSYGFSDNNGRIELLIPGRHLLLSPVNRFLRFVKKNSEIVQEGPVSIVRVKLGQYGFADNNAHPEVLLPGLHVRNDANFKFDKFVEQNAELLSHGPIKFLTVQSGFVRICYIKGKAHVYPEGRYAINDQTFTVDQPINLLAQQNLIVYGPVSVVRVKLGQLGFADHNSCPVVLLPGLHIYNDATWRFDKFVSQYDDFAEQGPIKFFTVKSGFVRVCYLKGQVKVFTEGRYAVNDYSFIVGDLINMQQQNVVFEKHPILLDGGIKTLVEGLLTYHVVDAERVVKKIGANELLRSVTNVSKAELSRICSTVHLEQISSTQLQPQQEKALGQGMMGEEKRGEGESRSMICSHVVQHVSPIVKEWGVEVINFQIESFKMADEKYAREYEEASLAMAKAKANLRASTAQNEILMNTAEAKARASKVEAEGNKAAQVIRAEGDAAVIKIDAQARKTAVVLAAEGEAESRTLEGSARNAAAEHMKNAFAQKLAMAQMQVEFASCMKFNVVNLSSDSTIGRAVSSLPGPLFNPGGDIEIENKQKSRY